MSIRQFAVRPAETFGLVDNLLGDDGSCLGVAISNEPSFEPVRFHISRTLLAQLELDLEAYGVRCFQVGLRLLQAGLPKATRHSDPPLGQQLVSMLNQPLILLREWLPWCTTRKGRGLSTETHPFLVSCFL